MIECMSRDIETYQGSCAPVAYEPGVPLQLNIGFHCITTGTLSRAAGTR